MSDPFHHSPDILNLLVETIPRLCRSKSDLLLFFQGAGVPDRFLSEHRQQLAANPERVKKFDVARSVLTALNAAGDPLLAARRSIIKRVVEWEDFSTCWENDRLKAMGLVEQVRKVVGTKDAFTRMKNERDAEKEKNRREYEDRVRAVEELRTARAQLKAELYGLFADDDPWRRGKRLESVLNRLCASFSILVREAFTLRGDEGSGVVEQIDGVIAVDGDVYLVEMKWHKDPLGPDLVAQHLVRVFTRNDVRALFVSASGFTPAAVDQCRDALALKVVALCDLEEVVRLLEAEGDLRDLVRRKAHAAQLDKNPYHRAW